MRETLQTIKVGTLTIRAGDVVRFATGKRHGPKWKAGGATGVYRLPGWFIVNEIVRERSRSNAKWKFFLEVTGLDKTAGSRSVFVRGDSYSRNAVRWRAYRVIGKPKKRKKGRRKR